MKPNAYVFIDAHVIRCRLHHNNNLKYSVALKSGKDQQVATDYKPSKDLIIEMDTHLALQADKHAYDNFPKLTLIVNVMSDGNEKKTVGTTFANFRKEGVQIFQVSECSCKDKAFEVEISFSLRVAEVKSSKANFNKNLPSQEKKLNYFSQQPTPRESRQIKADRFSKPLKDNAKPQSEQKIQKLKKIHSQKLLMGSNKDVKNVGRDQKTALSLQKQVEELSQKVKTQEQKLEYFKHLQVEFKSQRQSNELLSQLLQLEEQKNSLATNYILSFESLILGLTPKDQAKINTGCITSFKVIEQQDEIIQMNEELQYQLQTQKEKNNLLYLEIDQLQREVNHLKLTLQTKSKEEKSIIQQAALALLTVQQQTDQEILITSICKQKKENSIIKLEEIKLESLKFESINLAEKITLLKMEIEKLELTKKSLELDTNRVKFPQKKSPAKPQLVKKQEYTRKNEKGSSSDKNWKPPIKSAKKIVQNPTSNIQISAKKSLDANSTTSADLMAKTTKIASTEIQSKTERQQEIQKSFDFLSNQEQSQQNVKTYNGAVYFTDGIQS